jgi:hypothetical protein
MSDLLQRLDYDDENDEQEEFIQSFIYEANQLDTVSMEIDDYKIPELPLNSTDSSDIRKPLNNEYEPLNSLIDTNNEFNYQNKLDEQEFTQSFIHETDTASMEVDNDNYEMPEPPPILNSDYVLDPALNSTDSNVASNDVFFGQVSASDAIHKPLNNEFKSLKPLIDVNNEFSYQNKADYTSSNQSMVSSLNSSLNDQVESPFKNQSENCYRLFWIDATEKSGIVYIIGKVINQIIRK